MCDQIELMLDVLAKMLGQYLELDYYTRQEQCSEVQNEKD